MNEAFLNEGLIFLAISACLRGGSTESVDATNVTLLLARVPIVIGEIEYKTETLFQFEFLESGVD